MWCNWQDEEPKPQESCTIWTAWRYISFYQVWRTQSQSIKTQKNGLELGT